MSDSGFLASVSHQHCIAGDTLELAPGDVKGVPCQAWGVPHNCQVGVHSGKGGPGLGVFQGVPNAPQEVLLLGGMPVAHSQLPLLGGQLHHGLPHNQLLQHTLSCVCWSAGQQLHFIDISLINRSHVADMV